MIIDQLFTSPLFEQAPIASPEQLAYNRLRAQWDGYQAMTSGGGNTAVSRDPAHAAKLATVPAEIARMAAALKAKGIDAEAQYDALSGPKTAPVDANQAYGGISEAIRPGVDTVASVKKLWQYINRNLTDLASNASFEEEHSNQPYIEDRLADLLKTADGDPVTIAFDMGGNLEFDNNVLYVPVGNMWRYRGLIYGADFVKRVVGFLSKQNMAEATDPTREKAQDMIYKYFGQIYDYGDDDGLHYLDLQGELWNQLMDKYDGEIEDIVAREPTEVLMQAAQELKVIADEMEFDLDEAGVTEGEYDSRKPFGVRYKVFAGREGRMTTREYWTSSEEKLQRAVDKIQALDNFYEIDGYSYPKESQGVAEGKHFKTAYGWAGGSKPGGGTYKHPDQIKADREAKKKAKEQEQQKNKQPDVGVAEGETSTPAIYVKGGGKYPGMTIAPKGWSRIRDIKDEGDAYFVMVGNDGDGLNIPKDKVSLHRIKLKNGMPITAKQAFMMLNGRTPDREQGVAKGRQIDEVFADQGSGSTDRDNADYMKRRNAAKKAGYTGRETKAGTWRVFKDGNAVAAAGPFKSADEAAAWIKKHKQGITEMDKSEPSAGRDTGPRPGPDREAKPITAKKATRDALDMLNRAVKDSHKKKDVKENQEIYSTVPFELARTAPGIQMAKMAGQSAVAAVKNKFDDLRVKNPKAWDKAMQVGGSRTHGGAELPADAGRLMGDRAEYMKTVKSAPSEWDDTTGSIGMDPQMKSPFPPLMKKLQAAMVQEGRVKELADDLKTMNDADFMKKYGKAKAAIRKDMTKLDEARSDYTPDEMADMLSGKRSQKQIDADAERTRGPNKAPPTKESTQSRARRLNEKLATSDTLAAGPGISRLGKKDMEPEIDFRKGLAGDESEFFEPDVRIGKPVEPNAADTDAFMSAVDSYGEQNPYMQSWGGKFADQDTRIAPLRPGEFNVGGTTWRRVEDPAAAPAKKEVQWIPSSEADSIASWKANNPGKSAADWGSIPAAGKSSAASGLPKMRFDRATNSLVPVDQPVALDLSPKDKDKFDRQTRSVKPADGSGANPNIDAATRDRARAWAAQQNAPGAALAGAMRSSGTPVDTAKNKTDWKTIYNLNKSIIGSNPNSIKPGMKLKMPDGSTYRVQPGDNLSKIAANQSQIMSEAPKSAAVRLGNAIKRVQGTTAASQARSVIPSSIPKPEPKKDEKDEKEAKKVDESRAARRALMARIVNSR